MESLAISGREAFTLIDVLRRHADGGDVQLTRQGDGTLTVGLVSTTIQISNDGQTVEEV